MKNRCSLLKRQLSIDITTGIITEYSKYILYIIFIVFLCLLAVHNIGKQNITTGDIYFWIFKGDYVKDLSEKDVFRFPAEWLIIFVVNITMVLIYPKKDFYQRGYMSFIRMESKKSWWISKIIWSIMVLTICYFIFIVVTLVIGFFNGGTDMYLSKELSDTYDIKISNGLEYIMGTYFYNYIIIITIGIIETSLTLATSVIISVGFMVYFVFACNFTNSIFFICNSTMIRRKEGIAEFGNVYIGKSLIVVVLYLILANILGYFIFRKKEVISRENI